MKKNLADFKEDIHKCSKCGLCQSVCPVYEQTGNDCSVSRGKFIMLNGVVKGDLKLNKNVNKYLDMCLKCNACKNFCPSGIDARNIFLAAKADYFQQGGANSKLRTILNSRPLFNFMMNCIKLVTNTYRYLKLDSLVKLFYQILRKFWLGKKIILANEFLTSAHYSKTSILSTQQSSLKIIYFKGCVNEYINPRAKNAAESVLSRMGVEVLTVRFECCGVPFLSSGNVEQFVRQAEFNLAQIPDDFDYFLTDCASCQNAFAEYENYIQDEKLLEKLRKINNKSLNIVDFVVNKAKSIEFGQKTTFTFHKPCHLENMGFIAEFLSKSKNVEYVEMVDFDKCCGFSGEFALKNTMLSEKISKQKVKNALDTRADFVLTTCPACLLGLSQGAIENAPPNLHALNFIEFLACAESIICQDSDI